MTSTPPRVSEAWAVILAAGGGTRLAEALAAIGGPQRKQYVELDGAPLFWKSARTFSRIQAVRGLVFVFPQEDLHAMRAEVERLWERDPLGLPWRACAGGARRQDSVRHGLAELPKEAACVLVHDAARPFASAALCARVLEALGPDRPAAIPGLAVTDTIKRVDADDIVVDTPERAAMRGVQTPQGFLLAPLAAAHQRAQAEGWEVTDDAMLMERAGHPVRVVPGEEANVKITTPADLRLLRPSRAACRARAGATTFTICRQREDDPTVLDKARPMLLASPPTGGHSGAPRVLAHSEGDVLLHAVTDACSASPARADIGQLFPDTDQASTTCPAPCSWPRRWPASGRRASGRSTRI
jgi:2-C-methyl-D-erythritol 4-phosphate cytidylyltransferase/2-C-methyl-D-erythritol 2,4-cyclodiphosphate synthase